MVIFQLVVCLPPTDIGDKVKIVIQALLHVGCNVPISPTGGHIKPNLYSIRLDMGMALCKWSELTV